MIEIRVLRPGDEDAARALVARFADDGGVAGDAEAWLADGHNLMVGAWVDGTLAGMAYGYHLARPDARPDMLLLYSIDVAPAFRRRGLGTAITRTFRAQAAGGTWVLTNASNAPAMRMYQAAGGTRPHDDDVMFRL